MCSSRNDRAHYSAVEAEWFGHTDQAQLRQPDLAAIDFEVVIGDIKAVPAYALTLGYWWIGKCNSLILEPSLRFDTVGRTVFARLYIV